MVYLARFELLPPSRAVRAGDVVLLPDPARAGPVVGYYARHREEAQPALLVRADCEPLHTNLNCTAVGITYFTVL